MDLFRLEQRRRRLRQTLQDAELATARSFSSFAFIEILAFSSLETMQSVLARSVASMNSPWVTLGSVATTFMWIFIKVQPAGSFCSVTVAVVTILFAAEAFSPSPSESAREKLPARAVAINLVGSVSESFLGGLSAGTAAGEPFQHADAFRVVRFIHARSGQK